MRNNHVLPCNYDMTRKFVHNDWGPLDSHQSQMFDANQKPVAFVVAKLSFSSIVVTIKNVLAIQFY